MTPCRYRKLAFSAPFLFVSSEESRKLLKTVFQANKDNALLSFGWQQFFFLYTQEGGASFKTICSISQQRDACFLTWTGSTVCFQVGTFPLYVVLQSRNISSSFPHSSNRWVSQAFPNFLSFKPSYSNWTLEYELVLLFGVSFLLFHCNCVLKTGTWNAKGSQFCFSLCLCLTILHWKEEDIP